LDLTKLPHSTVEAAAKNYLEELEEIYPVGPVSLMGHSFGGWIAFEMARRLTERGRTVASLLLLDSEAPDEYEHIREYTHFDVMLSFIDAFEQKIDRSLGLAPEDLPADNLDEFLKVVHKKLVAFDLMSKRTSYSMLLGPYRGFESCLRANYVPDKSYDAEIHLIQVDDHRVGKIINDQKRSAVRSGWMRWVRRLDVTRANGNHVTLLQEPYVTAVTEVYRQLQSNNNR
jgi:thioesterase domain-containing protein